MLKYLSLLFLGKKKRKTKKLNEKKTPFAFFENEFIAEATLDYHTMGVLDHFQIEHELELFIEDAYYQQLKKVLIITGKGQVVRPVVQKALKTNKYVAMFKQAGYFNGQSGAFEVTLNQ